MGFGYELMNHEPIVHCFIQAFSKSVSWNNLQLFNRHKGVISSKNIFPLRFKLTAAVRTPLTYR